MDYKKLAEPFPAADIEWRAGSTNADKTKAMALAYINSRAVMNRLDDVAGPENWQDMFTPAPSGGVMCGISIRINDGWVTKWDVGENTDFEAIKGGFSDAFKRAAVKWGIGRYLYDIPAPWVECEQHGKSVVLKVTPPLPSWALPQADKKTETQTKATQPAGPGPATDKENKIITDLTAETVGVSFVEVPVVSYEEACKVWTTKQGNKEPEQYTTLDDTKLSHMADSISKKLLKHEYTGTDKDNAEFKLGAIRAINAYRQAHK